MGRTLTDLPEELILRILGDVPRLDDLYSLMLTSKMLYRISTDIGSEDISRMALRTGDFLPGLRPYQHILLIPSARRLADWAVQSDYNRKKLASSMHGGIDSLVTLAMQEAPITLDEIRKVYRWKQDILNPLSDELEQCCGRPSEPTDYLTVCETPSLTWLIWAIYGELFHHSISYVYSYTDISHPTPLDSITRFKFLVYCMPDVNSFSYMGVDAPAWFESMAGGVEGYQQLSLNHALHEYLDPALWGSEINELVPGLLEDGDGDRHWNAEYPDKDRILVMAVLSSGTKALDVLQVCRNKRKHNIDPPEEMRTWLRELHAKISALAEETQGEEGADNSPLDPQYDPWILDNWVCLRWDELFTLWDSKQYSLRPEVEKAFGEEEGWNKVKKAIGKDPLAGEKN